MQRQVQPEWLDELAPDSPRALGSRRDLRRLNRWMGNVGIMSRAVRRAFPGQPPRSLVELGAGDGSFMLRLARGLTKDWKNISVTLVERQNIISPGLGEVFSRWGWELKVVQAEVSEWLSEPALPPCDVMLANLFLHHFSALQLQALLTACAASTGAFVAVEPRRSPLALVASRSVALIGCNTVTRHDAPISVRAGFVGQELSNLWPQDQGWSLRENAAGLFSHLFMARWAGRERLVPATCSKGMRRLAGTSRPRPAASLSLPHPSPALAAGPTFSAVESSAPHVSGTGEKGLKSITIIGGGLAGLTLGIALRQRGIPVTVYESGHYPRHRVCGEFISGQGQEVLKRLGLWEVFLQGGATMARTAAFFLGPVSTPVRPLPVPALCLSRFILDDLLAKQFRAAGGVLHATTRWRGDEFVEGLVRASGRRSQPCAQGWRWFGLKVHVRQVSLLADLEMHAQPNSYVGICRLNAEEVNVCGIFRRRANEHGLGRTWQEILRGEPGTSLHARLAKAVLEESSFCSVAALSLGPVRATSLHDCCLGDALTMIPPVTGNGMSMAFEAADLATEPLAAYSRGELSWEAAHRAIARACDERFRRRLAWAKWLHWMMFTPVLRTRIGGKVLRSERLWRLLFWKTR